MTERDLIGMAEYQNVLDQPLLDRPRLEMARALQEIWVARAAHIRYQILDHRLIHLDASQRGGSGLPLKQSLELKKRLGPEWQPPFDVPVAGHAYHRGFVEHLKLTAASLLADSMRIMSRFPVVSLRVEACSVEDLERLASSPAVGRLISLSVVAPGVGDQGVAVLLESPHLQNLKVLGINGAGLSMRGYELVAEATRTTLRGLEAGFLSGNKIPDPQELEPSYDSSSGARIHDTVGVLPLTGQILEENFGYQKWLHWSRFPGDFSSFMFERPLDMHETPLSLADVGVE